MSARSKFSFSISDLSRFLGKSPVTLRGWERQGLITFPRNGRGDRRFDLDSLREISRRSVVIERVDPDRLKLMLATVTLLEIIEK